MMRRGLSGSDFWCVPSSDMPLPPPPEDINRAKAQFKQATAYQDAGMYDDAIAAYQKARDSRRC